MDYTKLAMGPCAKIEEAAGSFLFQGEPVSCRRYGNGHINDTYLLTCKNGAEETKYILQRMNTHVFQDPRGLMKNVSGVTSYLRSRIIERHGDPDRETLTLVKTRSGDVCCTDSIGSWWRMYLFIKGATTYDAVEKPEDFYQSAKAFGNFQCLLADYPVNELNETIRDFHNTPARLEALIRAAEQNKMGRAEYVKRELNFVLERTKDIPVIMENLKSGRMPYRVTHNDTKLNNIMIDNKTRQAICVIDLDTIMPGASVFDYGDSIRFGANTGAEDETDLNKVSLSLSLFQVYTEGFLEGCRGSLTQTEISLLPMGAKLMTLECGMRFLTDYLEGDTYFKIHREHHNLERARCQFKLVADMEEKWGHMERIVKEAAKSGTAGA